MFFYAGMYSVIPTAFVSFDFSALALGFVMTPVFVFMLPKHERMDEIAYKRGQVVSEFRRAVAWIIDIVVIIFDGE